jgi:hypothetical protein
MLPCHFTELQQMMICLDRKIFEGAPTVMGITALFAIHRASLTE